MYHLDLKTKALDTLSSLKNISKYDHDSLLDALTELEMTGLDCPKSRRLFGKKPTIYRMRVGRWRCLYTIDQNNISVWIIDIEKDTRKDYNRWIEYIRSQS